MIKGHGHAFHLRDCNSLPGLSGPSLGGANKLWRWPGDPPRALRSHGAGKICKGVEMKRGRGSKHSTPSHRSLLLSPWDACPYIKMWFGALAGNTARRGWMRGIGFTVQTTEPQSPSCSTTHTQLLACVVFVHVLYIWAQGVGGRVGRGVVRGCSQDPFYRLQEVQAGMRVCTSRKCNLNIVYDANLKKKIFFWGGGSRVGYLGTHTHAYGLNPVSMQGPRMSKHSQRWGAGWHG